MILHFTCAWNNAQKDPLSLPALVKARNVLCHMTFTLSVCLNTYHVEFLKWSNPPSVFDTFHYHFKDIKMKTLSWSANSIRAWSDFTDVQAGLALYWWQWLINHFQWCKHTTNKQTNKQNLSVISQMSLVCRAISTDLMGLRVLSST